MELQLVTSVGEIRGSLQTFNRQVKANHDRARSLLRQASYWVYDRHQRAFGPSKFVGFVRMDFATYELTIQGVVGGGEFNGHATRVAIEGALGRHYTPSPALAAKLCAWGELLLGPGICEGVDETKWRFAQPPPVSGKPQGCGQAWGLLRNGTVPHSGRQGYGCNSDGCPDCEQRLARAGPGVGTVRAHLQPSNRSRRS